MTRQKKKTTTCLLTNTFNQTLDRFIKSGIPLEVGLGKYSAYIVTKNDDEKYKFITKIQTKKTFIGYAKILGDLKRPEISILISDLQDNVKESNNVFYAQDNYISADFKNAVCIDLNSAYLQALYNLNLITIETKMWIEKNLNKNERLVAVGMLAKQKEILHFNEGKIQQDYKEPSKHRYIFNAVIQEVAGIMMQVKTSHIEDFIAYWVDGIYLKNEFIAYDIVEDFEKAGFPCKIENVTEFKSRFKFNYMEYTYLKDGVFKILNLPIKSVNDNLKRDMMAMVNSYRLKHRLEGVEIDIEDRVYIGALQNKSYSQAGLFD